MSQLKDSCNKEIFIVYNEEENDNNLPVKIYITSEFMELTEYISKLVPSLDFGIKVLHGILTSATILPKNLKGRTVFLIIADVSSINYASIFESSAQSDKDLAIAIHSAISHNYLTDLSSIENIYVLYGYEISTILSLNEEEIDEEIIDTCQKVVNNINTIKSLTNN